MGSIGSEDSGDTRVTYYAAPMANQLLPAYPYYLANRAVHGGAMLEVRDKFSGEVATNVSLAGRAQVDAAIAAAVAATEPMRRFKPHQRAAVLQHCVVRFAERVDELAFALCVEAGKPIKDARGEVARLIDTFRIAAEEATRIEGTVMNLELSSRNNGLRGMTQRVPIGPCSFITPFNFPLNLVAHKVAPAIAAGCPFVLKPADRAPLGALIIGEILAETDLPIGAFSILTASIDDATALVEDERIKLLSFTGGLVGWALKARAGKKKVTLELGGNAACIVDGDQRDVLDTVVERLIFGAYYQSGQSCISVQRILAHGEIYDALREKLVAKVAALVHGDPKDEKTFIGPVIDEASAKRLESWIRAAVAAGGTLLCGGTRQGAMLRAAVLEHVPATCDLSRKEAFGPVVLLERFTDFDKALAIANASDFGLQAGVFTHDLDHAMRAWDRLEVGGVIVNDVPSIRVDNMPYGGVKNSGLGREGVRFAIEDMTELRLLVIKNSRT